MNELVYWCVVLAFIVEYHSNGLWKFSCFEVENKIGRIMYIWRCQLWKHWFINSVIVKNKQLKLMGLVHAMRSNGPLPKYLKYWFTFYPDQYLKFWSKFKLRQSTSALAGDPDPYLRVFQFQNTILGSMQVSATGWLGVVSQKLTGSQVPMGPQVLESTNKYLWY